MKELVKLFAGVVFILLTKIVDAAPSAQPTESVLPPNAQIIAGDPKKDEFYILGEHQPVPAEAVTVATNPEEEKEAISKIQVAINKATAVIKATHHVTQTKINSNTLTDSAGYLSVNEKIKAMIKIAPKDAISASLEEENHEADHAAAKSVVHKKVHKKVNVATKKKNLRPNG